MVRAICAHVDCNTLQHTATHCNTEEVEKTRALLSLSPLTVSSHCLLSLSPSCHCLLSLSPLTVSSHSLLSLSPVTVSSHSLLSLSPLSSVRARSESSAHRLYAFTQKNVFSHHECASVWSVMAYVLTCTLSKSVWYRVA